MYSPKKPCAGCPFLREGGVRLHPRRAEEIAENMLNWNGGEFSCHKTTVDDGEGGRVATKDSLHCAGALIFALKNGVETQMMRIAGRLPGLGYDPDALMADESVVDSVFGDLDEMVETNRLAWKRK